MIVYLIGFMGSGKSTLGRRMAASAGWKFEDLDTVIERAEGRSLTEIFELSGEEYFREVEAAQLRSLPKNESMLLACGGGTPCHKGNMEYMNSTGTTVYIKHRPATLKNRLLNAKKLRPLVRGLNEEELAAYIESTLAEREKWYNQSDIIIDGLKADPGRIMEIVTSRPSGNHG